MIFKELILKNFKSHINSRVKFDQGTTLILGENGAGKSSIFFCTSKMTSEILTPKLII